MFEQKVSNAQCGVAGIYLFIISVDIKVVRTIID